MISKLKLVAWFSLGIFVFSLGYKLGYSKLESFKEELHEQAQQELLGVLKTKDATIRILLQSIDDTTSNHSDELNRLRVSINSANERDKQATTRALQKQIARERELQLRGAELLTRINSSYRSCARQIETIRVANNIKE